MEKLDAVDTECDGHANPNQDTLGDGAGSSEWIACMPRVAFVLVFVFEHHAQTEEVSGTKNWVYLFTLCFKVRSLVVPSWKTTNITLFCSARCYVFHE